MSDRTKVLHRKFTPEFIKTIPDDELPYKPREGETPNQRDYIDTDCKQLKMRATRTRTGVSILFYTRAGTKGRKKFWSSNGSTPLPSLDDLREHARKNHGRQQNNLPTEDFGTRTLQDGLTHDKTLQAEFKAWLARGERKPKYITNRESWWKNHVQPTGAHNLPMPEITEAKVNAIISSIDPEKLATRDEVQKLLCSVVNRWRLLTNIKLQELEKPLLQPLVREALEHKVEPRKKDFALSEEPEPLSRQVKTILQLTLARTHCKFAKQRNTGRLAMMLITSGMRFTECRSMRWDWLDIDSDHPTVTLPGEFVKNGKKHVLPLTQWQVSLLREARAENKYVDKRSEYVFPAHSEVYSEPHLGESALNKFIDELNGAPELSDMLKGSKLTVHQFRKTYGNFADTVCGVSQQVVSAMLNHGGGGVTKDHNYTGSHLTWKREFHNIIVGAMEALLTDSDSVTEAA